MISLVDQLANDDRVKAVVFDGGNNFGPTRNLSNNDGLSIFPVVAISGNNVYVAWWDDSLGNSEILYRRSTNNGASFGPIENLSNSEGVSTHPAIAASGNNMYVVWDDSTSGNAEILYRRSADGGANFSPTQILSANPGGSADPSIAASGKSLTAGKLPIKWCSGFQPSTPR